MPKNTIVDLRNHLFATLEALTDKEKPMEIDRARAICSVAGKVIDAAKVEVKFYEVTGAETTGNFFLGSPFGLTGDPNGPDKPNGQKLLRR
jgi:hypothetical protein